MIRITNAKLLYAITRRRTFKAFSFANIVIFRGEDEAKDMVLNQHEFIHYLQQLELLFVFQWILYFAFYLIKRAKGADHWTAYRFNPFEQEAYDNQDDKDYHLKRKSFAWWKYVIR